jgi:hypothetical protein
MKDEIQINNIKFWVGQNIIYCKLYDNSNVDYSDKGIEDLFYEAISMLSDGTYLPVIFDFREVNSGLSVKLFKLLSNSVKIKSIVLSKAFLIKNYKHKMLLLFHVMFSDSNVPNLIFKDSDLAIQYSNQNYAIFNSVTYDN